VRIAGANPSRGPTRLALSVGEAGRISAEVVDVAGRHLRTLSDSWRDAGPFTIEWDGRADDGSTVAAGVYLVRATASGEAAHTRVIVLP
jgi:flagellar hook assembly protein FlgD